MVSFDQCGVCLELFSVIANDKKAPISGSCGHNFCAECVQHLQVSQTEELRRKVVNIQCPVCRNKSFRADTMVRNLGICDAIASLKDDQHVQSLRTKLSEANAEKKRLQLQFEVAENRTVLLLAEKNQAHNDESAAKSIRISELSERITSLDRELKDSCKASYHQKVEHENTKSELTKLRLQLQSIKEVVLQCPGAKVGQAEIQDKKKPKNQNAATGRTKQRHGTVRPVLLAAPAVRKAKTKVKRKNDPIHTDKTEPPTKCWKPTTSDWSDAMIAGRFESFKAMHPERFMGWN
jgi:hypothetical protein